MARFSTAPVTEVAPQNQSKAPSQRAQQREEYRTALKNAVDAGEALVIELDQDDKALTIRNRVTKAATALGYDDLTIRRKGTRIMAYRQPADEPE